MANGVDPADLLCPHTAIKLIEIYLGRYTCKICLSILAYDVLTVLRHTHLRPYQSVSLPFVNKEAVLVY